FSRSISVLCHQQYRSPTDLSISYWNLPCQQINFLLSLSTTTEIYTLSLHDALPISSGRSPGRTPRRSPPGPSRSRRAGRRPPRRDRKSTRLNSSHVKISYAVFCLKKKINKLIILPVTERASCKKNKQ